MKESHSLLKLRDLSEQTQQTIIFLLGNDQFNEARQLYVKEIDSLYKIKERKIANATNS